MNTPLGEVVTADEVCHDVQTALEAVLPEVFAAVGDPAGRELLAPRSYEQVPTRDAVISANLPAVGIFSPGTVDAPERDENGWYSKVWRVTVAYYLRGNSYTNTQWAARTAAALIQAALVQSGIRDGVWPASEAYDLIESSNSKTLAGVAVDVDVRVAQAFSDMESAPYEPTSTVLSVDTDVDPDLHPALQ